MAQMLKPQPIEVYKDWLKAILDEASDQLTDWESNFISNIENRLTVGPLTEGQANKLESIYVKYTN